MGNVIYYFTGTGNSLQLAEDIAAELGDCRIINIADAVRENSEITAFVTAERIGFIFPVYFYGLPRIAHTFFRKLKIAGNTYLFCIANCGGANGRFHNQVKHYLKAKGHSLNAGFTILMPDNYIILYNTLGEVIENELTSKAKHQITDIAEIVRRKKTVEAKIVGSFFLQLFGWPINRYFLNSLSGRGKRFKVAGNCIGCGKCARACSVKNISMQDKKPVWNNDCEFCLACIHSCPIQAINYKNNTQKRGRYLNPILKNKEENNHAKSY